MSRHEIAGRSPAHRVYVGWDAPLQSYFAQVYLHVAADEEEGPLFWIGADYPEQVDTLAALADALKPYAELTTATYALLQQDRQSEP